MGGDVTCQLHVQCSATSGQSLAEASPGENAEKGVSWEGLGSPQDLE